MHRPPSGGEAPPAVEKGKDVYPPTPIQVWLYPPIVAFIAFGLEAWVLSRVRIRKRKGGG
ncbi:MAG: hypothetical protein HY760_02670 [Nitrospirae bacterium]|nr:hypothetical protein [Nitrospirota bacterium]